MALYHSAKGSVNYTVLGSPTIVDGVVSGFSSGDYLKLPQVNSPTQLEGIFCVNTGALSTSSSYICRAENHRLSVYVQNRRVRVFFQTEEEDWDTFLIGTTSLANNTKYWIKFSIKAGEQKLWVSTDGISYTLEASLTKSTIYTENLIFDIGVYSGGSSSSVWVGTIDLNETYIKVNGQPWFGVCPVEVQKHQLKGPVGYTIVGNPTIVDGVASGFSSSDYVIATQAYPTEITSYEKNIRFQWAPSTGGYQVLIGGTSYDRIFFSGRTNCLVSMRMASGTMKDFTVGYLPVTVGNWYILNVKFSNNIVTVNLFDDEGSVLLTKTFDFEGNNSPNTTPRIGQATPDGGGYFRGSIDLNETYIKVDSKLWFYQPADTKYIVKDGKLVWADPRIKLICKAGISQYLKTNYIPNTSTVVQVVFSFDEEPAINEDIRYYILETPGGHYASQKYPDQFSYAWWHHGPNKYASWFFVGASPEAQNYFIDMKPLHKYKVIVSGDSSISQQLIDITTNTVLNKTNTTYNFDGSNKSNMCIFGKSSGNTVVDYSIHQVNIIEDGVTLNHFVPVPAGLVIGNFTVPSNGMFDIINQQFYANQGTGEFAIGRDE